MIEFSIIDEADQQFATVLDGRRVTIRLRYNVSTDRWSMDLSVDDLPVLTGRRVVTGIDLLAPFNFGIGAIFAAAGKPDALPGRNALPRGLVRLYHATYEEVSSVEVPDTIHRFYLTPPEPAPMWADWMFFDGRWRVGGVWRDDVPWF